MHLLRFRVSKFCGPISSLSIDLMWILAGDFNAISDLTEKRGGISRLEAFVLLLQDNIATLNLVDIKPTNG